MSLYLKHRPSTLDDVRGNAETVKALRALVAKPPAERPRAVLLVGGSGCGKTTICRILAREYGVADPDFREVDSADYRGIDSVRDIRQQMRLKPLAGPMRAWLLDECHQATKDAQAALLKALEDTPAHVLFLLATTDPQKLLPTIRNRCATFEVRPLAEGEVVELLRRTARAERKRVADEALDRIARDCLGSPRAALVLLDKVIDLPRDEQAAAAEGAAAQEAQAVELFRALLKGAKWRTVAPLLKGLQDQDPETIRRGGLGYMQSVLLGGGDGAGRAAAVIDAFWRPTYDVGWPGLTLAVWEVIEGRE